MTTTTHVRSVRPATIDQVDSDHRVVTVRLVPWGQPKRVADPGGRRYVESYARGGLTVPDHVLIEREHGGPVVAVIAATHDRDDGLYADLRMSRSSVGTDTLADIEAGILRHVSIEFDDDPMPPGVDRITRTAARLYRVAFTTDPQLDAPIVAVRSNPPTDPTTEGDPAVATTLDHDDTTVDDDQVDDLTVDDDTPAAAGDQHQRSRPAADRRPPVQRNRPRSAPVAGRFESFGHFARSAALGEIPYEEHQRYARALADVTLADNPGLDRERWMNEVIDLARTYTPTIQAFRRVPLPTDGTTILQPRVKTRPLVGLQADNEGDFTEKESIVSGPIEIERVSWDIETYAGGNDVSLQLIQRSQPSFMNEMMRLYIREMAQKMNAVAAAELLLAADSVNTTPLGWAGADTFDELLITASATFLTNYRRFAEIVVMSVDAWVEIGEEKDSEGRPLYAGVNPANPLGTFSLRDGQGNVRQLEWWVDPELGGLGDGVTAVVGVREAFVSAVGPVGTLTADVPAKIGRDIAVYQEAAFGPADAAGLMLIEEPSGGT